jgi:hypothetical protein
MCGIFSNYLSPIPGYIIKSKSIHIWGVIFSLYVKEPSFLSLRILLDAWSFGRSSQFIFTHKHFNWTL